MNFSVLEMNFRVRKTNFRVRKSNFRMLKTNFNVRKSNFRALKTNFRMLKIDFRLLETNFKVLKTNFRVLKIDFRVLEPNFKVPKLHRCAQRRWRCNGVGVATPNADLFWRCCQRNVLRNGLESWAFLIWLPQEWWIKPGKASSLESKAPAAVQCKAIKINDNQRK